MQNKKTKELSLAFLCLKVQHIRGYYTIHCYTDLAGDILFLQYSQIFFIRKQYCAAARIQLQKPPGFKIGCKLFGSL